MVITTVVEEADRGGRIRRRRQWVRGWRKLPGKKPAFSQAGYAGVRRKRLHGWILRAERYFNFYKFNADEQMDSVVVLMEGDALRFFQLENRRRPIEGWWDLRTGY